MKVVLFCGGLGVRMGEETQRIPKPMIPVGSRPILWHIMQYYSAWGHRDFVLCLGYRADVIKEYFLSYNPALTNDFVLEPGTGEVTLLGNEIADWRITFVDSGVRATIAERLKAAEPYLGDNPYFLATYGDGLTDAPLPDMIDTLRRTGKTALLIAVRPTFNAHVTVSDGAGVVQSVTDLTQSEVRINGGYFVFKREILDEINPGEELVDGPFSRLIERRELIAYEYDGFWRPMDTIKDKQQLDAMLESGIAPWRLAGRGDGS